MIQVFKYLPDSGRPFLINFIPAQNQIVIQGWTFSESRQAFKLVNHVFFFFCGIRIVVWEELNDTLKINSKYHNIYHNLIIQ